jgi:hypothetical protein
MKHKEENKNDEMGVGYRKNRNNKHVTVKVEGKMAAPVPSLTLTLLAPPSILLIITAGRLFSMDQAGQFEHRQTASHHTNITLYFKSLSS